MGQPAPEPPLPLQRPGAGLPWWELRLVRHVVFPAVCRRWGWADAAWRFQEDGARVLAAFDALPRECRGERVLVRRLAGMEDSSRFWSAAMTVEHLTTVGTAIRGCVAQLRRGDVPGAEPRTEDFKPSGAAPPEQVRAAFVRLLADAEAEELTEPPIPRGRGPRFAHPWFGPLDAYRWHALLTFHQSIHLKQIEAITKRVFADPD